MTEDNNTSSEMKQKEDAVEVEDETKNKVENSVVDAKNNNLTISTKLSTDQLICKSPKESPNLSLRCPEKEQVKDEKKIAFKCFNSTLYLGVLQILFGMLMSVFGVLVIVHGANLSQIGGGLWGGCLAVATGTTGVLAAAKECCPLKRTAQRVAHTVFLALSLISLAVAQLVLVVTATGLARDVSRPEQEAQFTTEDITVSEENKEAIPVALLSNICLLIASALECICAAIASYQGARAICPCFRSGDESYLRYDMNVNTARHALVNSWLGKQSPPPLYVVTTAPPSIGKHSKISSGLPITPIFTLPPPIMTPPSIVGYPLIPAPLGPVASPIIRPHPKEYIHPSRIYTKDRQQQQQQHISVSHRQRRGSRSRSRSRSKSKERPLTTEDVAKTYTGLDRMIAEEFIDMCDSHNNSLCSESSCQSCCQCSSQVTCHLCANEGNNDTHSREYLVENKK